MMLLSVTGSLFQLVTDRDGQREVPDSGGQPVAGDMLGGGHLWDGLSGSYVMLGSGNCFRQGLSSRRARWISSSDRVQVIFPACGRGAQMARVVMQAVVSVDCYIAYPDDTVGPLFDWYRNGDAEVSARASGWTFHVSQASADYVRPFWDAIKVTVIGRHLFDTTNGWDGDPAAGDDLVVVTHRPLPEAWLADHPDAPFHTAGSVEAGIALAKKLAGDGLVCVTAGDLGGQAFSAGLVDEIAMDVAPVVLGEGVRFFGSHAGTVLLDDPDQVVRGDRVLHLHYTIRR